MRCWTDGKRSVFWKGHSLEWLTEDGVERFHGVSEAEPYGPLGAMAVHPSRNVVWIGGDRRSTWRIDVDRGESSEIEMTLADACFVDDDEIWALTGPREWGDASERRLIRFRDDLQAEPETLELPATRPVRWPYGPAYAYASNAYYEPLSNDASFRIVKNAHGVCLASAGGYIWGFPNDGDPFGWNVAEVYQGWLVARLGAEGVVATALQNGRTGEVVFFDRDGRWYDAFDSKWSPSHCRLRRSPRSSPAVHHSIGPRPYACCTVRCSTTRN